MDFLLVVKRSDTHFLNDFFLKMREVLEVSIFSLALNDILLDLLAIEVHHVHRHVSYHLVIITVSTFTIKNIFLEHLMLPNNLNTQSCFFVISNSSVVVDS